MPENFQTFLQWDRAQVEAEDPGLVVTGQMQDGSYRPTMPEWEAGFAPKMEDPPESNHEESAYNLLSKIQEEVSSLDGKSDLSELEAWTLKRGKSVLRDAEEHPEDFARNLQSAVRAVAARKDVMSHVADALSGVRASARPELFVNEGGYGSGVIHGGKSAKSPDSEVQVAEDADPHFGRAVITKMSEMMQAGMQLFRGDIFGESSGDELSNAYTERIRLAQRSGVPVEELSPLELYDVVNDRWLWLKEHGEAPSEWADDGQSWIVGGWDRKPDGEAAKFLRSMAVDMAAYAPFIALESAAIPQAVVRRGGLSLLGRVSMKKVAQYSASGAAQVFVLEPGGLKERSMSAAISVPLIAAGTAGMAHLLERKAFKKVLMSSYTKKYAGTLLRNKVFRANMGSKEAVMIARSVRHGIVDERTVMEALNHKHGGWKAAVGFTRDVVESTARAGRENTRSGKLSVPIDELTPDQLYDGAFSPRATARVQLETQLLLGDLRSGGWSQRVSEEISESLQTKGLLTEEMQAALDLGPGTQEFDDAVKTHVSSEGSDIANRMKPTIIDAKKEYPWLANEDLDHAAAHIFNAELQLRTRGIDAQIDLGVVDAIRTTVDDVIAKGHLVDGRNSSLILLGGRVNIAQARGGMKAREYHRPMFRAMIELFADPRPGLLGYEGIHELSHAWLELKRVYDPTGYKRLAAEVGELYTRHLSNPEEAVNALGNPAFLAEAFANFMTGAHHAIGGEGTSFLKRMTDAFGDDAGDLLGKVAEWRKKFYGATRTPSGASMRTWSPELQKVSKAFSDSDWAGLATMAREKAWRRKIKGSTRTDPASFFDIIRETILPSKRQKGSKPPRPRVAKFEELEIEGLRPLATRRLLDDVKTPILRHNFDKLREVFHSTKLIRIEGSNGEMQSIPVRDFIRKMAVWYRDGEKSWPVLRKAFEAAAGLRGVSRQFSGLTDETVAGLVGANGTSRGPAQNLREAVAGGTYSAINPRGHYKGVTLGSAMRSSIVMQHGIMARARAVDVLEAMADWGQSSARTVLNDYPIPKDMLWDDFMRTYQPADMAGSFKLNSYGNNLFGGTDTVTNDIHQFRFFLWNKADHIASIYNLAKNPKAYLASVAREETANAEAKAKASAITARVKSLQRQMSGASDEESSILAETIAIEERRKAAISTRGAKIKRLDKKTGEDVWRDYEPSAADYHAMEDIQFEFARVLNAHEEMQGSDFRWEGRDVQAAIWGLMRGTNSLKKVENFDQLVGGAIGNWRPGDDPEKLAGSEFMKWFDLAHDSAKSSLKEGSIIRGGHELATPYGPEDSANKLWNAALDKLYRKGKYNAEKFTNATVAIITRDNKAPLTVAKVLGASRTISKPAMGMFRGDVQAVAEITWQAKDEVTRRGLHYMAALNHGQRAWEFAFVEKEISLLDEGVAAALRGGDADAIPGVMIHLPAEDISSGMSAVQELRANLARRMGHVDENGRPLPNKAFDGATTKFNQGRQTIDARLSSYGITDGDAFLRNVVKQVEEEGGTINAWTGRSDYFDVFEDLASAGGEWSKRWREVGGTSEGLGGKQERVSGVFGRSRRAREIATARHLKLALEGLEEKQQRTLVRDYLLTARQRQTFAHELGMGKRDVNTLGRLGDGEPLVLMNEIEVRDQIARGVSRREARPVISEELLAEEISFSKQVRGKSKLPLAPGRKDVAPYFNQTRQIGKRLGLEIETFHDALTPEDMAKIAAARARRSATEAPDDVTRAVRSATAERAESLAAVAGRAGGGSSPAEHATVEALTGGTSPSLMERYFATARNMYRNIFKNRFQAVETVDKEISDQFNRIQSTGIHAEQVTTRRFQRLRNSVDHSPEEWGMFERLLHHEKMMIAVERDGLDSIGPGAGELLMPAAELEAARGNRAVNELMDGYRSIVQPEMEAVLIGLDPENEAHFLHTESGAFIPSVRYNERFHGKNVRHTGARSSVASKHQLARSSSMKRFSGAGDSYVTDIEKIVLWRLSRDLQVLEQKNLIQSLSEKGLLHPAAKDVAAPSDDLLPGKHFWTKIRLKDAPAWTQVIDEDGVVSKIRTMHEEAWVPSPVADAWKDVVESGWAGMSAGKNALGHKTAWALFADMTTAAMLATMAEASRHSLRVLSMLSRIPTPPGMEGAVLDHVSKLFAYFGPRLRNLGKMMNVYARPEAEHLEGWMARVGGLPARAFEAEAQMMTEVSTAMEKLGALGKKAGNVLHYGRKFLFDLPDTKGKGIWGFDVRARLVATNIFFEHLKATGQLPKGTAIEDLSSGAIREFDSDLREFLTQFGMFNSKIQTKLVQGIKRTRLNPFAGAQAGFRPAEIETFFGMTRLPMQKLAPKQRVALGAWYATQSLAGGAIGYMGILMLANKQFSGRWPWENQEGHEFDLELPWKDFDGTPAYISVNFLEPAFARSMRTLGLKYMLDERYGMTTENRMVSAFTQRGLNEIASFGATGPPVTAAWTAASGTVPYYMNGSLMQVAKRRADPKDQMLSNVTAALVNLNGSFQQFFADSISTGRHPENPALKWTFEASRAVFGHIGSMGKAPLVESGNLSRSENRKRKDIVWQHVAEYAATTKPEKRSKILRSLASEYGSSKLQRQKAMLEFWSIYKNMPKSAMKRAQESAIMKRERENK